MGIISLNYGGENEAPLGDNSILETARRPWGHSDSLRGKILFPILQPPTPCGADAIDIRRLKYRDHGYCGDRHEDMRDSCVCSDD